jgi:signal transduction histidine kinase
MVLNLSDSPSIPQAPGRSHTAPPVAQYAPAAAHVSCLGDLPSHQLVVSPMTTTQTIIDELERSPHLPGILICAGNRYLGMISRSKCFEHLSRPFGTEVYLRRPAIQLHQAIGFQARPIAADTPIDQAVDFALSRPTAELYEPLVVQFSEGRLHVLDLHTLLLAQSRILADAKLIIEQQAHIGRELTQTLDLRNVLDLTLQTLSASVPFERASILLNREGQLEFAAASGYPAEADRHALLQQMRTHPAIQQVYLEQTPLWTAQTALPADWHDTDHLPAASAWMAIPVSHSGQTLGIVEMARTETDPFTLRDLAVAQAQVNQASIALQNALLYETLEARVRDRTRELSEANARLNELDQIKDEFVANVSHELRTPLANIQLYVKLLAEGKPERRDEYFQTLNQEIARLHRLIEDLLDLNGLDLGSTPVHATPFDLNQVARNAATNYQRQIEEYRLRLDRHLDHLLPMVTTDQFLLTRAAAQLIVNAIAFTPRGGHVIVRTGIRPRNGEAWITFSVKDNGPGVPAEELPHIFTRFYRGRAARQSRRPGTGLGLSICSAIMTKLGGQVTVDTGLGQGSEFILWVQRVKTKWQA